MNTAAPIPMLLWCPECGARHVDEGEFATKAHHTHACQDCGHVWQPAVMPTVGVQFLPGFKNEAGPAAPTRINASDPIAPLDDGVVRLPSTYYAAWQKGYAAGKSERVESAAVPPAVSPVDPWQDVRARLDAYAAPAVIPASCLDCGMAYGGPDWLDLVLPRWQWLEIHPAEFGVLCANCIVKRASKLPGALSLHGVIGISNGTTKEPPRHDPPCKLRNVEPQGSICTDDDCPLPEHRGPCPDERTLEMWRTEAQRVRRLFGRTIEELRRAEENRDRLYVANTRLLAREREMSEPKPEPPRKDDPLDPVAAWPTACRHGVPIKFSCARCAKHDMRVGGVGFAGNSKSEEPPKVDERPALERVRERLKVLTANAISSSVSFCYVVAVSLIDAELTALPAAEPPKPEPDREAVSLDARCPSDVAGKLLGIAEQCGKAHFLNAAFRADQLVADLLRVHRSIERAKEGT